jgi:hypothetical protein
MSLILFGKCYGQYINKGDWWAFLTMKLLNFYLSRIFEKYGNQIKDRHDKLKQEYNEELQKMLKRSGNYTFSDKVIDKYFKELLQEYHISPDSISPKVLKELIKKWQLFLIHKLAMRRFDMIIDNTLLEEINSVLSKTYTPEQKKGLERAR